MKRILAILMVSLFMVAVMAITAPMAFADPDCTGPPSDRPGSCKITEKGQGKESGKPEPGKFVGPKQTKNPEHKK